MLPNVAPESSSKREAQILALARDLNQSLTVIAHYADACSEKARQGASCDSEQILDWSRRIVEEVERSGKLIRGLVKSK